MNAKIAMALRSCRRPGPVLTALALVLLAWFPGVCPVGAESRLSGRRIMDEVMQRHHLFPYVFETQTMILTDAAGHLDVRKLRRFSRVEQDGSVKFLLVFDHPIEIRGVSLLAIKPPGEAIRHRIYLPAFGPELKTSGDASPGSHFLGTDFVLEDLAAEELSEFDYTRLPDHVNEKAAYFVVEAHPRNGNAQDATRAKSIYSLRRHHIRQDTFFIVRTDYYDLRGRFYKRQTFHDLTRVDGDMWRANMVLMEDHRERHKTLVKIGRRIFSEDYVPAEMFSPQWLFENRHLYDAQTVLIQGTRPPPIQEDISGGRDEGLEPEP